MSGPTSSSDDVSRTPLSATGAPGSTSTVAGNDSFRHARGAFVIFLAFSALRALGQGSMTINGTLLTAQWFVRRRGIAVAICASGNYVAGTIWPPLIQWGITNWGWRDTYVALGLFCAASMAAFTSSASAWAARVTGSSVAGSMMSIVPPAMAGFHRPSI